MQIQPATLATGSPLKNARLVRHDSQLIIFYLTGPGLTDPTGATINVSVRFGAKIQGSLVGTVIQKTSMVAGEIVLEAPLPNRVKATIVLQKADTASLTPGTRLDYDIEVSRTVSIGDPTSPTNVPDFKSTIEQGRFEIVSDVAEF